jgi:exodeoxyribonuclease VIII
MAVIDHRYKEEHKALVGIWEDISSDLYHGDLLGITRGDIGELKRSFMHFIQRRTGPTKKTPAMEFGSMFHACVLEPARFTQDYISDAGSQGIDRRTKEGKIAYESFLAFADGKTVVKDEDFKRCTAMADALFQHPTTESILRSGKAEQTAVWVDPKTNIFCKVRPDYLRYDDVIVDLKTAERADYTGFQRAVANFGYHIQAAMYTRGIEALTGRKQTFLFVVIEKEPPYAIAVYNLEQLALDTGTMLIEEQLDKLADYYKRLDAGTPLEEWAGYPVGVQEMRLPTWA